MKIKPLEKDVTSNVILFESHIIKGCNSFDELIEVYQKYRKENIGKTVIVTIDDLSQAEYTSAHATMYHNLDDTTGYDLSGIDPLAFENGKHIGNLSTPSEFFIRKDNFKKMVKGFDFSKACERGLTIDDDEIQILEKIHNNPLDYFDEWILLKIVPVNKSYEAICGFPNGYFMDDFTPFENYAIAKHLNEKYNYDLFAIGASLLGFIRDVPLKEKQAKELVSDLIKLYNSQESITDKIIDTLRNNQYLFIKYIDTIEHLSDVEP